MTQHTAIHATPQTFGREHSTGDCQQQGQCLQQMADIIYRCVQQRVAVILTLGTVRPMYRTGTPLPSKNSILYSFSTNICTEFFKHAALSPFISLQNAVYFIMLPF
jgi:hypothetical protein